MTGLEILPGACLLLASFLAVVVALINHSRGWTWLTVNAVLFVLSDVADLIFIGPAAMSTPLQRSLGVSVLVYVIGRMLVMSLFGFHWSILAKRQRQQLEK